MHSAHASLVQFIRDAPTAVAMFDGDMRYVAASRGWIESYRLASDIEGRSHYEVFPEIPERWRAVHQRALAGEVIRLPEDEFVRRDGSAHWLRWEVRPWRDETGHVGGIVIYTEDITSQRRAEQALRESEERLRLLGDNLPDSAVYQYTLDENGTRRFLHISAGVERLNGVTPDAVLRDASALYRQVDPGDRERLREAEERSARDLVDFDVDFPLVRPDGERRWMHLHSRPRRQPDGRVVWDGVMTDTTTSKRSEEDLRRSRDTLRAILEAVPAGIIVSNTEGRIVLASAAAERLSLGLLAVGRTVPDPGYRVCTPDGVPVPPERLPHARALAGESVSDVELLVTSVDGSQSVIVAYATPLDGNGTTWAAVTVFVDITARKQAEKAVQEADRRKDEFIAILSHELRNPLAPIRYALPLLRREGLGDEAARALAVIDRQVGHLTRLVDDLLDISRITSDKIELRREQVDLASVVAAAIEAASPVIAAARHHLLPVVASEPIWLDADPARLAQVVTNLLNNSAKYTPRGGQIVVEALREADQAVVRVRDSGIGLSPEALSTVFEMFRQVPHVNKAQGGLGVGLALAKRLVEMHGGTLEARSEGVARGAEFVIRLPLADRPAAAAAGAAPAAPSAAGRRLKVLVVDDNPDLVEMLTLLVERAGHEVRKALDGRSAVAAALAFRPDVVLLDLGLPVMNGLEVARELRQHPETAGARFVALTGWGQRHDREQTRAAGFERHLTKPTDAETLEALLSEYARQ